MDCSFVGAFGKKFELFCTNTFSEKLVTNAIDIKCITWGVTNSRMLDEKSDGCWQWFLSHLACMEETCLQVSPRGIIIQYHPVPFIKMQIIVTPLRISDKIFQPGKTSCKDKKLEVLN